MGRIRFRNDIYKQAALISIIILFAFVLRFVNLGYSNYQREETRAMFLKGKNQSSIEFLLDQRKGPAQFLVSRVVQVINPSYQNQFISRLPFAAASFLSVIFFFLFVKNLYNDLIAFFSTFFFATNGIIVGLSRIVQYQSLVFFFTTLTLASLVFALKKPKFHVWGLYIGMVSWALALLSHYDGIFIAPMVIYLIYRWIKESAIDLKEKYIHLIISSAISISLVAAFYIPFIFSITQSTLSYFVSRVQVNPLEHKSGSIIIFNGYQPIFAFYLYLGLAVAGFFAVGLSALKLKGFLGEIFKNIPGILTVNNLRTSYILVIWFLFPFVALEVIADDPGTHIYNYLIPLFIIMGIGIWYILPLINLFMRQTPSRVVYFAGLSFIFFLLFTQSYQIFVDHRREYPWESKKYLFWDIELPYKIRLPLYGFPYYRNWEGISRYLAARPERMRYVSNEKKEITSYYLPDQRGKKKYMYIIYIRSPQIRVEDMVPEFSKLFRNETPIYTFEKNSQIYSAVFRVRRNYFD
ncbi:MAG: ArnT family glycosyltransferase [Anaerolineales bacterium]